MKKVPDLHNNNLLKEFIQGGEISLQALKKLYRKLSLTAHPDVTEDDGAGFIMLNREYTEILNSFEELAGIVSGARNKNIHYSYNDLRRDFYDSLHYYVALGLHSPRVRMRADLQNRNQTLIDRIIQYAKKYDPDFIAPFNRFNEVSFHSFSGSRLERMHKKIKQKFLLGLSNAINSVQLENEASGRTALSYFKDIRFMPIPETEYASSIYELSNWFIEDINGYIKKI